MPDSLNAEENRPFCGNHARRVAACLWACLSLGSIAQAAPKISTLSGSIFVMKSGARIWQPADKGYALEAGDQVRTDSGANATIIFDDGTRINLGPNGSLTLYEATSGGTSLKLSIGSLRAWVNKALSRHFEVRTPTAVCAVRGTEFSVNVNAQGHTDIQMFSGLLAVADYRGDETLIRDQESLRVTDKGFTSGQAAQTTGAQDRLRDQARREVGLEMSKEAVQSAAAIEAMNAVYKEGKAIIDVSGNRVRIEEYIVRPAADQFKLVVLNERTDRFDYFFYHGTFNSTLPDDLSIALRQLPGCIGSACQYYLTGYDTGRSNTQDNMLEVASGGHQVDVNNNGAGYGKDSNGNLYPFDAVLAAFDPKTNQFISLNVPNASQTSGNDSFYQTLYNSYSLTFNGVEHGAWSPSANAPTQSCGMAGNVPCIQNIVDAVTDTVYDAAGTMTHAANSGFGQTSNATGGTHTTVQSPPVCAPPDCTYNETGVEHQVVYADNIASGDGSVWEKYDSYVISDEGRVAGTADFVGSYSGADYKQTLLHWNFETIVTASEFDGRKIDLAVEPKIFIESGLIQ